MSSLDDRILAGIQRQKDLDPSRFTCETSLLENLDFASLLGIILAADESLPSLDLEACQSYLSQGLALSVLLNHAYEKKSFSDFVKHPLILSLKCSTQDTVIEPASLTKSSGNRSFQAAFEEAYQGDVHRHLIKVLNNYLDVSKYRLYNRSISVIQSSGMGKSRLVQQAANEVFTIPANLREALPEGIKAYPPPDEELRSYFEGHELKSDNLLQAEYAIVLKHMFEFAASKVSRIIRDQEGGNHEQAWLDYLNDGQNDKRVGENRRNFYKQVVAAARDELSGLSEAVWVDTKRLCVVSSTERTKSPNPTRLHFKLKYPENLEKKFEGMCSSAEKMLKVVSPGFSRTEVAGLVYFDEAHNLTNTPQVIHDFRSRNPYHNLGTVLKELCNLPIFFIFLSTNSHLQQFAPPPRHHPSARASRGSYLIPPFTELPFDVFMTEMFEWMEDSNKTRSLVNACTTRVMSSMGRPLWFAHYKQWLNSGHLSQDVLDFAGQKLTAQAAPELVPQSKLAALSVRIGINFESTTHAAREAEFKQVESHMRVVYAIPKHKEYMRTGSSSEPVLAEAAAKYLDNICEGDKIATLGPRILSDNCENGFLARGERGELCGRLLMTIAHDIAITKTPPEIREDYEVKFHQPVPVPTFLCALFADRHHETILNATPVTDKQGKKLKDAFKDAFVCFSHFALAADSEMLDASALRMALFRGMAIQAKENQASIDAVIPIHMGPITSAIKTETTSAINLQFKNRKISQDFYVNQRITVPDFKQPVISIVLELGEKLREVLEEEELNRLVEVHHWDLPGTRSRTRVSGPHQDDRHYSFVARGCRPETYKAIPEAARKTYPIILASGGLKDDFPRAENKTSWELVEELKPTFIAAKCRAEWNRWDHLDTKKLPDLPTPSGTKGGMKEAKMSGNRGERKKNGGGKLKSGEKTVSGESKVARKKRKSGDK